MFELQLRQDEEIRANCELTQPVQVDEEVHYEHYSGQGKQP